MLWNEENKEITGIVFGHEEAEKEIWKEKLL